MPVLDNTCRLPSGLHSRIRRASQLARRHLLASRTAAGYWTGHLSNSALSTATAVCALAVSSRSGASNCERAGRLVEAGLGWLARNQNSDGGWGDTTQSLSNISTTALCWAAFGAVPGGDSEYRKILGRTVDWLCARAGSLEPGILARAIIQRYGKDRTFSVPILTMCALAGRLGPEPNCWRFVLPLPFELAAFPRQWFAALRLPVVSYALPALIAIGQARHFHLPSRNPIARILRCATRARTLRVLEQIQPSSGGFLEATPLTSFVVMSLACSGEVNHPVTQRGLDFLQASARDDGSWPIDTNLATWVTTLAVQALSARAQNDQPAGAPDVNLHDRATLRDWLLTQQYQQVHPYTNAAAGGWAWTPLPGGVPDADDTAGALLALRHLGMADPQTTRAGIAGLEWLMDLQNRDGGIPTFCRGWGALPFDRSSPDLTAHALRAWVAWMDAVPADLQHRLREATRKALAYLQNTQRSDGSWVPLWFGNQFAPDDENPVYGTARVIIALHEIAAAGIGADVAMNQRAVQWLLQAQASDGSWGAFGQGGPSTEETALALEALSAHESNQQTSNLAVRQAIIRGAQWLIEGVESDTWAMPAPIGFYFAKLWYFEQLYPVIFATGALGQLEGLHWLGNETTPPPT